MSSDERAFFLGPKFFANLRRATLSVMVPLTGVILAVALFVHPPGASVESSTLLIAACLVVPAVLFGAWRGYRRQVSSFEGFILFVSPDRLRRVQPGLPEMEIARSEVVRLVEAPGKSLVVFAAGHQRFIAIPASLTGFEEVRALLASWRTPEERRTGLAQWYPALAGLLTVLAFGLVVGSSNKLLVTILGVALIGALLYSVVAMRRSPHVDARVKKVAWFILFALLAIASRIWVVWQA
jgi:hypothetical protein